MGCVYSTPQRPLFKRSDDGNSNGTGTLSNIGGGVNGVTNGGSKIFDVINVDDRGNEINHGQIEITENDLILHQRNKNSIVWPLRSLRRYGFDAELFSFECGRRCSTGPGIYAFKCVHAEQLFNVLQESLQHCSNIITPNNHITSPQHAINQENNGTSTVTISPGATISSPVIPTTPGPPELAARAPVPVPPPPLLPSSPPHSYVNDIRSYINSPFYANTAVLNGTIIGLPVSSSSHVNISKGRAGSARSASDINTNYAKLDDLVDYVNIDTAVAQYQTGTSSSSDHAAVTTPANCVSSNLLASFTTNPLTNFETTECSSSKQRTSLICEEIKLSNFSSTTTTTSTTVNINSTTNTTANGDSNCSTSIKPPILPIKPLSALAASSCPPSSSSTVSSTAIQGSSSSHSQQPDSLISPKVPRKSESGISESLELNEMVEPVNYIILDLENTNTNNNNGPTYVTTGPATPIFKTPEEGAFILPGTTPPSTPTSIKSISSNYPPQSYATIDFDKTLALSNSAASHRKF